MPLAAMLVNADHTTLEYGEIAFGAIDADGFAGLAVEIGVFLTRVIDLAMVRELFAELGVLIAFVGHQMRLAGGVGADDRREIVFLDAPTWNERAAPPRSTRVRTAFLWP